MNCGKLSTAAVRVTMSEFQYGLKDKFLTKEELYEFRFLTTVLAWTNPLKKKATVSTNTTDSGHSNNKLYPFAEKLTNLLVRDVEVVAVTASDAGEILFQTVCDDSGVLLTEDDTASEAEEESEPVGYVQSLCNEQRSKTLDEKEHHPALQVHIPLTTADGMGDSIGCWLLSKTERHLEGVTYPRTTVSFSQHAANLVHLIKATYEQTSKGTTALARDQLRNYVLLTSTAKIASRIQKGSKDRNFYDYLSKPGGDLDDFMLQEGYHFRSLLLGDARDVLYSNFTEIQRKMIVATIKFLERRSSANADKLPCRTQEALENTRKIIKPLTQFKDLLNTGESTVYNQHTASLLQDILSAVLDNLVACFEWLAAAVRNSQLFKISNYDALPGSPASDEIALAGHYLDHFSKQAGFWLDVLTQFKKSLRKYLYTNLGLLRKVHMIKNAMKTGDIAQDTKGLPGSSTPLKKQQTIDPEFEQLDSLAERQQWEHAAMAWLDLICLHWTAILDLRSEGRQAPRNKVLRTYWQQAKFQHFETRQEHQDRRLIIKSFLENFTLPSGEKLTTDECQKIRTWLLRNGDGYSAKFENEQAEATNFTGTYHCETVLLSLALLAKKQADILDVDINSASAPLSKAHLQLPGKTTTDALKGIGQAIAHHLLSRNHKVVLVSRTESALSALQSQYGNERVAVLAGDMADASLPQKAVDLANERWGRIDSLIVNHGTLDPVKKVGDSSAEEWRRGFDVNVFSAVGMVQAALPSLRKTSGTILLTSSGAATSAYQGWGCYGAGKAVLNHLALTLSVEEPSITTISIRPGVVDTEMQREIREVHHERMSEKDRTKFSGLKKEGGLLKPEQPGYVMARLAVAKGEDVKGFNGQFLSWNDESLGAFQRD
ncbi:uncharacterized protein J4E84_000111 [Alternaria hordeiaustralica]|uniref:uncharacterized protein n=1 Tax=Alternaria hordeiaustralica TaxID=1187925 RepID=UPI0020C4D050|nr:uncharacterized protein J4E84_000111 [Alternaria hordeiaustralica]KAI4696987.1 hypothetical protein J4E84_000111 [Alternaria hordeiaustralica]